MKRSDIKKYLPYLGFVFAAVIIVLGVFACSVRRGVWSTLPTILLAAVFAELIYSKWLINLALFSCCALITSISDGNDLLYCSLFCICVTFCYVAVHLAIGIFKKKKKLALKLVAVFLFLIPVVLQLVVFSDPFTVSSKGAVFREYLEKKYPEQIFSDVIPSYNFVEGKYQALVNYDYRGFELENLLKLDETTVEDGYFEEFCRKGLESMKNRFVSLIRAKYPNESLWIDCSGRIENQSDVLSGKYGESPNWLEDSACCDIGFKFSINNKNDFLEYVKQYYNYICSEGFEFYNISFYGGFSGMYKYCVTIEHGTDINDIAALIKNCNISMKIPSLSMEYSYLY